jgi:hypothetical protein
MRTYDYNRFELGLMYRDHRLIDWAKEHHALDEERVRKEMEAEHHSHDLPSNMAAAFVKRAEKVHPISRWHREWFYELAGEVFEKVVEEQTPEEYTKEVRKRAIEKLTDEERQLLGV